MQHWIISTSYKLLSSKEHVLHSLVNDDSTCVDTRMVCQTSGTSYGQTRIDKQEEHM